MAAALCLWAIALVAARPLSAAEPVQAEVSRVVPYPPKLVWGLIGEFGRIHVWHPAIKSTTLKGDGGRGLYRILGLEDGGEIHELFLGYSYRERFYGYTILRSPLPVDNYTAALTVQPGSKADESVLIWSSQFEPKDLPADEAIAVIEGMYRDGFDYVDKVLSGEVTVRKP